jgi:hypothetical protein
VTSTDTTADAGAAGAATTTSTTTTTSTNPNDGFGRSLLRIGGPRASARGPLCLADQPRVIVLRAMRTSSTAMPL